MTPEMKKFIDLLESQLGYREKSGSLYTKFGDWYGKTVEFDADYSGAPWCDMYLSWAAYKLGYQDWIGQFAWTVAHAKWFREQDAWGKTPKPGAIVFYDWRGTNNIDAIDHVGIVTRVEGGKIYTIEGNIDGGVAKRKKRDTDKVVGYGYPEKIKARLDKEAAERAAEEQLKEANAGTGMETGASQSLAAHIPRLSDSAAQHHARGPLALVPGTPGGNPATSADGRQTLAQPAKPVQQPQAPQAAQNKPAQPQAAQPQAGQPQAGQKQAGQKQSGQKASPQNQVQSPQDQAARPQQPADRPAPQGQPTPQGQTTPQGRTDAATLGSPQGDAAAHGRATTEAPRKGKHAKHSTADTSATTTAPLPVIVDASPSSTSQALDSPALIGSALIAALAVLAVAKSRQSRVRPAPPATVGAVPRTKPGRGRRRRPRRTPRFQPVFARSAAATPTLAPSLTTAAALGDLATTAVPGDLATATTLGSLATTAVPGDLVTVTTPDLSALGTHDLVTFDTPELATVGAPVGAESAIVGAAMGSESATRDLSAFDAFRAPDHRGNGGARTTVSHDTRLTRQRMEFGAPGSGTPGSSGPESPSIGNSGSERRFMGRGAWERSRRALGASEPQIGRGGAPEPAHRPLSGPEAASTGSAPAFPAADETPLDTAAILFTEDTAAIPRITDGTPLTTSRPTTGAPDDTAAQNAGGVHTPTTGRSAGRGMAGEPVTGDIAADAGGRPTVDLDALTARALAHLDAATARAGAPFDAFAAGPRRTRPEAPHTRRSAESAPVRHTQTGKGPRPQRAYATSEGLRAFQDDTDPAYQGRRRRSQLSLPNPLADDTRFRDVLPSDAYGGTYDTMSAAFTDDAPLRGRRHRATRRDGAVVTSAVVTGGVMTGGVMTDRSVTRATGTGAAGGTGVRPGGDEPATGLFLPPIEGFAQDAPLRGRRHRVPSV
ncbi:CHAP domain-containing protein [Nonomuraea longicatena]|uniref:Peptidase C51 domain-containing protein n=1 Tax=Nonomuraea longicatena TaxID=83682 RepID=A0ABN1QQB8_9ACTN